MPIELLEMLTRRSLTALKSNGIDTVEQLLEYPARRLRSMPNIGPTVMQEVCDGITYLRSGETLRQAKLYDDYRSAMTESRLHARKAEALDRIADIVKAMEVDPCPTP